MLLTRKRLFASRVGVALAKCNMSANAIQAGLFVIVVALLVKPVGTLSRTGFRTTADLSRSGPSSASSD